MPSYLVSAKESFVPQSLYKPPIEALGDMLRIKQQQYLQGFNAVNSQYTTLQNASIVDETGELTAAKQQYLAEATEKLKNLSKVDLSLNQNVQAASQVFEPMLNDQALMMNIRGKQHNDAQISKLNQWRDSKDEKERDLYDPAMMEHLLNDRQRLAKAGTDVNKYKEFKFSNAVPFTNINKYLDEEANKEGAKVVRSKTDGVYLVKTTNGVESIENYENWAASKLDQSKFAEQFSILGDVEYNQKVRQAARDPRFAGYSDDQLRAAVKEEMKTTVKSSYADRISKIEAQLKANETEVMSLGDINVNGTDAATQRTLAKIQNLKQQKQLLERQKTQLSNGQSEIDNVFDRNPQGYFGQLARQRHISSWATGKAAMEQTEVSKNDAYFSTQDLKLDQLNYQLNERKQILDEKEFQAKLEGKIKSGSGKSSEDGTGDGGDANPSNSVVQIGTATNEVKNTGTAREVYKKHLSDLQGRVLNSLYDSNSGVIRILSKFGASDEDIMYVGSALAKEEQDISYNFSKEQKAAADRLTPLLETQSGMKIKGPQGFKQALFATVAKYFNSANKENRTIDPEMSNVFMSFNVAHAEYQEAMALRNKEKELVTKNVLSNPEYSKLIVDKDGQKEMVDRDDIGKYFKGLKYVDESGNIKNLNREQMNELADKYMSGKNNVFTYGKKAIATPGGMAFQEDINSPMANLGGKDVKLVGDAYGSLNKLSSVHGSPQEFSVKYNKASGSVVPNIEYFQGKTGRMDTEILAPFTTGTAHRGELGIRALQDLSSTSNVKSFFVTNENGERTQAEAGVRDQILGMLRDEDTIEKFFDNPKMIPAQGVVKFRLKPGLSGDVLKANGLDKLVNKDFVVEVSENAKGAALNQLLVSDSFYTHGQLLKGQPIASSPLLSESGFSFKILPSRDDESANTATIHFKYKQWNPELNGGDWEEKTGKSEPFIIRGPGAISPDVLYNNASSIILNQWNAAMKASNQTSPGPKVSAISLYKQ